MELKTEITWLCHLFQKKRPNMLSLIGKKTIRENSTGGLYFNPIKAVYI